MRRARPLGIASARRSQSRRDYVDLLIGCAVFLLILIGAMTARKGPRRQNSIYDRGRPPGGLASHAGLIRASGRGTHADTPAQIGAKGWREIAWRVYEESVHDRVSLIAAGVAFFTLLSLFPALAALVALYGIFADPASIGGHLAGLEGIVPREGLDLMRQQIEHLAAQGQGSLSLVFIGSLAVSLWSSMSGLKTMFDALNIVYDEDEKRGVFRLNLQALLFTLAGLLFVILALGAIVVVPVVAQSVGAGAVLPAVRWPVMYLLVLLGLAALYRYGPSRARARWRWVTWGGAVAGLLWIVGSILFSWYVASFASYNKTYGSLGAAVAFMVWLWLSAVVILLGAEINAEMERQTARDTTEGPDQPLGQRGARMADEVA